MILDRLENADRYLALHPGFPAAFRFLRQAGLEQLPDGRHEIVGREVYAVIARGPGRSRQSAPLEAHRKYIDIQLVLAGADTMGWKTRAQCNTPAGPYDAEKDLEFFADPPEQWITVGPSTLAVFFPHDAHAPLVSDGRIHKVVVKVAV